MGSACCVYAITAGSTPLPAASRGAPASLTTVAWRELAAVTAPMSDDRAPVTMRAVLHHEAIVEAVRKEGPALPVRFGTMFRDEASVASAIAARYEPLVAELDRLGDKVELSLTALWGEPLSDDGRVVSQLEGPLADEQSGAGYLLARAAEERHHDAMKEHARTLAHELDQVLRRFACGRRVRLAPTPRVAMRAAYLLDASRVGDFQSAFESARRSVRELRVLMTGPWPPYSFVRQTDAHGATAMVGGIAGVAQRLADAMRERLG